MQTTYSSARQNLASLMDRVVNDREEVVITRAHRPSVALIALDELESLRETAHLLRSPANALRLQRAYEAATRGEGRVVDLEAWGRELGLAAEAT
jgi:antitoxin YefM